MPIYYVNRYENGVWDGHASTRVEAENELQAAQEVCGEQLTERGGGVGIRATVSSPDAPNNKKPFYPIG